MHRVSMLVNGRRVDLHVEPRNTLAEALREQCGLTGTKLGCEQGSCGACTVIHDGKQIRSCLMFAVQAEDAEVWTIEGLSRPPALPALAGAFKRNHGLQCGFCTPGMLITGAAMGHAARGGLDDDEIREGLSGNICRCTGYQGIVKSIAEIFGTDGTTVELSSPGIGE
ncbi:UNVERIFIED_CONTAM: hypothetical protein GTU68_060696 [Idotea baltica]|nr:hypothetical protein [Idotea baltica]